MEIFFHPRENETLSPEVMPSTTRLIFNTILNFLTDGDYGNEEDENVGSEVILVLTTIGVLFIQQSTNQILR